jgi:RNA polymerase sigma factor (sigma-70 family)
MEWKSLTAKALEGDQKSLTVLISAVQDKVYNLCLRMLVDPEEAQDASQEILIKVLTKLSQFEGKSSFPTWVYRIASNSLLDIKKSAAYRHKMSWEEYEEGLHSDLEESGAIAQDPEYQLLLSEVRMGCTMAMLLCLGPEKRLAYIFGEIFELSSRDSAEVLGITAANYRKRLSRARDQVQGFMSANCGLINPEAKCHCELKVLPSLRNGRVNPQKLYYAKEDGPEYALMKDRIRQTSWELRAHFSQSDIPVFESLENFSRDILAALL